MTYDDWKTTDDTPQPDPNRCEKCGHPEGYCDCPCCFVAPQDESHPHANDALENIVDDMLLTDEQRDERDFEERSDAD